MKTRFTGIAAIVAVVFFGSATLVAVVVASRHDEKMYTFLLPMLLAQVPAIFGAIVGLAKVENTERNTDKLLNGEGHAKTKRAVHEALDERSQVGNEGE